MCGGYEVSGCSVFKREMSGEVIGHMVGVPARQRCTYGANLEGGGRERERVNVGSPPHHHHRLGEAGTYHFRGGLGVVCSHVLLQGHLCVAHPAAVGTGEGLGLLHREGLPPVVQVWRQKGGTGGQGDRGLLMSPEADRFLTGHRGAVEAPQPLEGWVGLRRSLEGRPGPGGQRHLDPAGCSWQQQQQQRSPGSEWSPDGSTPGSITYWSTPGSITSCKAVWQQDSRLKQWLDATMEKTLTGANS